jgi:hypothetical protein
MCVCRSWLVRWRHKRRFRELQVDCASVFTRFSAKRMLREWLKVGGQLARERERAELRKMNMGPEQVRALLSSPILSCRLGCRWCVRARAIVSNAITMSSLYELVSVPTDTSQHGHP